MAGHLQQLPFVETFQAPGDGAVATPPEKARAHGRGRTRCWPDSRSPRYRAASGNWRPNSAANSAGGVGVVLRYAVNVQRPRRAAAINALQERQRHLANRTGGFEKRQQHRPARQQIAQRNGAVFQPRQLEIRRATPRAQQFALSCGSHEFQCTLPDRLPQPYELHAAGANSARVCRTVTPPSREAADNKPAARMASSLQFPRHAGSGERL